MITNTHTNKKYIGQAVCYLSNGRRWGTDKRWKKHLYQAETNKCECRLLENAIRKYGQDSFDVTVLIECGIHELNDLENSYIHTYNTLSPNGYNLMTGGGNGRLHSIETKQKMSRTRTGKTHTDATKEKIGEKHKGKTVDNISREKIGSSSRYRNMKSDHKQKIESLLEEQCIDHLPMYINYITDKKRQSDGFVVRFPNTKPRKYMSKSLTLTQKYILATQHKHTISNQRMSV